MIVIDDLIHCNLKTRTQNMKHKKSFRKHHLVSSAAQPRPPRNKINKLYFFTNPTWIQWKSTCQAYYLHLFFIFMFVISKWKRIAESITCIMVEGFIAFVQQLCMSSIIFFFVKKFETKFKIESLQFMGTDGEHIVYKS